MPKGSSSSRCSRPSCPTSLDVHQCSMEQLVRLPAEVLWIHLSLRHLITSGTKSVMAQRLYHAIHNIDEESPHVSATSTTTSPPIAIQSSIPLTMSMPAYSNQSSTQPTTSTLGSQLIVSLTDIAACVSSQPILHLQFSSIMSRLMQLASAPNGGNLSPASTVDTPPQLPITRITDSSLVSPPIPPTFRANQSTYRIPIVTTTSYLPNSSLPVVSATTQLQSSHTATYLPSSTLPPVPAQLRLQILQGEYIDFAMLFSYASEVQVSSSRQPVIKSITSFDTWMQAWNIYIAVLLAHNPLCAVELFGYQRLICSANTLLPVHSWLQYDSKFRILAAADPLLRWDQ